MDRPFKVIVVGIEKYDDAQTWKALDGVEAMAARVAGAFGAEPLTLPEGGLKAEAPRVLKEAIGALPERATLLVHWIGHGVTADQHYLVCRDSPGPALLDSYEAIPSGEIGRIIANSRAERVVVVLDTCYSGEGGGNLAQRYRDSLARELDREGWQRVACVIAASHPLDKAVAGRFSKGMVEVLEKPDHHLKWSRADAYIDPERLAIAIRDSLGEENKAVHPRFEKSGLGQDIIPNPLYRPMSGADDLETRRHLEAVFGEHAHFNLAASGIEAGEAGYYFTGRRQSQRQIINWLSGDHSNLMVVTGPPGSGKSALIGRIVTLTVPEIRAQLRTEGALRVNDPVPSENAIDIAIHAKGKSVFQVATALGRATKLDREVSDQPGIVNVLERMKAEGRRRTIVIDALDEAGSGQAERIANEIIRPLVAMPNVRVLVGTRRSLDGALVPEGEERHSRLIRAFGANATIRDLADEPETSTDIAEFVARRLRASKSRGPDPWIAEAGRRVAAAADGSFLYARLVARSLEAFPDAPLDRLPASAAAAFAQDIVSRFRDDQQRITDMLRALAFGLGRGVSRAVWAPIASALAKERHTYSDDDVVSMLRNVGSYIVESTVETDGIGQAVYRLIHQALADHLKSEQPDAHWRIVRAITRGLEGEAWLGADLYLRRHLLEHAVLADQVVLGDATLQGAEMQPEVKRVSEEELADFSELERLFCNQAILAISEPAAILAMRSFRFSAKARRILGIYQLAADRLASATPTERWSLLHLTALTQGDQEWVAVAQPPGSSMWHGMWASTRQSTPHLAVRGHESSVWSVAVGKVDGQTLIVSGDADGKIQRWNAEDGSPVGVPMLGHNGRIHSIALGTVNGRALIVSSGDENEVRLWDAVDGTAVGEPMRGHQVGLSSVAMGAVNGRTLIVTGDRNGTIHRWDAEYRSPVGAPTKNHEGRIHSIALGTVNGRALIVSGDDCGEVRLWDAVDGKLIGVMRGFKGLFHSVALGDVDGRPLIVSGSELGTVRSWDSEVRTPLGSPMRGHDGRIHSVALDTINSRALIVSGGDDGTVRRWDAERRTPVGLPMRGHEGWVLSVATGTVNGRALIVTGGADGTVRLWDADDGPLAGAQLTGQASAAAAIAAGTVNGRSLIVTGGWDGAVRRWSSADGTQIGEPMTGHGGQIQSIALGAANGRTIIVSRSSDGSVRRWDAESGIPVGSPIRAHKALGRSDFRSVALGTVNGRVMIVFQGSDGTVWVCDAKDRKRVGAPLKGPHGRMRSVAVGSAYGRVLVVIGGADGTVRMWDVERGSSIGAPMRGHKGSVRSVAVGIVNGRASIVSAGGDSTVRLWDVEHGAPVGGDMRGHAGWISTVVLSRVNQRVLIASGGEDGAVRMWNPETSKQILSVPLGQAVRDLVATDDGRFCASTGTGIIMLQTCIQ